MEYQQQTAPTDYGAANQQASKKSKIIVALMIMGILVLVVGGFIVISSRKDPNLASAEKIVAVSGEIARVSDLALQTGLLSSEGSKLAATAHATSSSNQAVTSTIITEELNGKVDKKLLASGADQANDDKIKQGQLLGDVDKTYKEILKKLLIQANAAIKGTSGNQEVEQKLEAMAASNEQVFNSIQ